MIEKAAAGNAAAFSEIYSVLRDPIYSFVYRMLNDTSTAEDICQEVFVFFIEHPDKYDVGRGSLFSFLCGVARNRVFAYLKRSGTGIVTQMPDTDDFAAPANGLGSSPLKQLLGNELSAKVSENVANLSPLQREAMILREIYDMSYEEIAKITETDLNTVRSRLYRARQRLVRELVPYLSNEEEKYNAMR